MQEAAEIDIDMHVCKPAACCMLASKSKNLPKHAICEPKMRSEHYVDRTAVTPTAAKDTPHAPDCWSAHLAPP